MAKWSLENQWESAWGSTKDSTTEAKSRVQRVADASDAALERHSAISKETIQSVTGWENAMESPRMVNAKVVPLLARHLVLVKALVRRETQSGFELDVRILETGKGTRLAC